jgi:hypothetical protein
MWVAISKSKVSSSIQAALSRHFLARAIVNLLEADQAAASTSTHGMISTQAPPRAHTTVVSTQAASASMAKSADSTKDTWKEAATADSWFKIRCISVTVGTMDTMHLCFHLAVFLKKLISFTTRLLTEFLEWECLKD